MKFVVATNNCFLIVLKPIMEMHNLVHSFMNSYNNVKALQLKFRSSKKENKRTIAMSTLLVNERPYRLIIRNRLLVSILLNK
mmetsp:Transcript_3609/g.3811  ORF Transcript_3609/g.3811 Transcript_3609/m.3811 type:complete len:82 (+) Transcript_3609:470-715(+)